MSFAMYEDDGGDYHELGDSMITHADHEEPAVTFLESPVGGHAQFRIEFNLDIVRIHTTSTGDVVVTLK